MAEPSDPMHAARANARGSSVAAMLWPARLHHVAMGSPDPHALARFYADHLDFSATREADTFILRGHERRLVVAPGSARQLLYAGFDLASPERVESYRTVLHRDGVTTEASITPFFAPGAFAVTDPDGNRMVFGAALPDPAMSPGQPGRLQHVVVASTDAARIAAFFTDRLGFRPTDWVRDPAGVIGAAFLRTDEEHHSFAVFRAPTPRLDHFSLEVGDWNAIRDWSDRFARAEVPIFWGPGRHGPGNNLFIMANDPDGNAMEFSAEITLHPFPMPPGEWPHAPRTLNLWGAAIMRS
jgi:catechol 2,3-dioxygenase